MHWLAHACKPSEIRGLAWERGSSSSCCSRQMCCVMILYAPGDQRLVWKAVTRLMEVYDVHDPSNNILLPKQQRQCCIRLKWPIQKRPTARTGSTQACLAAEPTDTLTTCAATSPRQEFDSLRCYATSLKFPLSSNALSPPSSFSIFKEPMAAC